MAKVQVQVSGGDIKQKEAGTVSELKSQLGLDGYIATVNGEPVSSDYNLDDYEFVTFSKAEKGGC